MKVVMIGGGSKEENYTHIDGCEVWGLNGIRPKWIKKFDRMFNIHMREHLEEQWKDGLEKDVKWANENSDAKFYVCDPWKDVPSAIMLPRDEMKFGRPNYHCGSFDWMTAFAIHLGATEISIHGVGLNLEWGEPISARACLEYWCGFAEAKGITVHTSKDCDLFYPYHLVRTNNVYGYDNFDLVEDRTRSS
jgi:hypothetical protein